MQTSVTSLKGPAVVKPHILDFLLTTTRCVGINAPLTHKHITLPHMERSARMAHYPPVILIVAEPLGVLGDVKKRHKINRVIIDL